MFGIADHGWQLYGLHFVSLPWEVSQWKDHHTKAELASANDQVRCGQSIRTASGGESFRAVQHPSGGGNLGSKVLW